MNKLHEILALIKKEINLLRQGLKDFFTVIKVVSALSFLFLKALLKTHPKELFDFFILSPSRTLFAYISNKIKHK